MHYPTCPLPSLKFALFAYNVYPFELVTALTDWQHRRASSASWESRSFSTRLVVVKLHCSSTSSRLLSFTTTIRISSLQAVPKPGMASFGLWDLQLQLLVPAVALYYVWTAPFTKVEESFTIQALHDWLFIGIKDIHLVRRWKPTLLDGASN